MWSKTSAIVFGLLCLTPLYTLILITRPDDKGQIVKADKADWVVVLILALCGLGLWATTIF